MTMVKTVLICSVCCCVWCIVNRVVDEKFIYKDVDLRFQSRRHVGTKS